MLQPPDLAGRHYVYSPTGGEVDVKCGHGPQGGEEGDCPADHHAGGPEGKECVQRGGCQGTSGMHCYDKVRATFEFYFVHFFLHGSFN